MITHWFPDKQTLFMSRQGKDLGSPQHKVWPRPSEHMQARH